MSPLVTTVIPTRGRPKLLQRAVRSVVGQTASSLQIRIYDNASTDETPNVIASMSSRDNRISGLRWDHDLGQGESLRRALTAIETPYFSILADDDLILPDFLQRSLAALERFPDAMFVATRTYFVDPAGRVLKVDGTAWAEGLYLPPAGLLRMLENGHFIWQGVLFRREIIDRIGNIDPAMGNCPDLDFLMRAAAHVPFYVLAEPGSIFWWHPGSVTSHPGVSQFWPTWMHIAAKLEADSTLSATVRRRAAFGLRRRMTSRVALAAAYSVARKVGLGTLADRARWSRPAAAQKAFDQRYRDLLDLDVNWPKDSAA